MKMKYKAVCEYLDAPEDPIQILKGEELIILRESDPEGDWPNWLYCRGRNKEGWVPRQILSVNGITGMSKEDYCAKEFNLKTGEILYSEYELNGWILGFKLGCPEERGWVPLNCLQKL